VIRVLVCDDQEVVAQGLEAILSTAREIEVVGLAYNGLQALELSERMHPDVVLMDLKMPEMNGIEATAQIRARYPEVRVLVLTTYDADEWVLDAVRAGASGYLLKDTPRADLIKAIEGTAGGRSFIDPAVAGTLLSQAAKAARRPDPVLLGRLSAREVDVLRLLALGLSNSEIAARLFLSEGTVRNYVSTLMEKLEVKDRTQAAIFALRHGLADSDA
jgi:DNA-binding NarL/FixJ family response regulator